MATVPIPSAGGVETSSSVSTTGVAVLYPRTLRELVHEYMAQYHGRDCARVYRLSEWVARLGDQPIEAFADDDLIFHALEAIAAQPARIYMGKDADGRPVHRTKGPRSPGTVNRYLAVLAAVFTWAIKRRRVAKGFENPCRKLERQPENPGVVRFLSDDERERLLAACRASKWKRLYLLVLLGITTGARRSELMNLRWRDIDLERAVAYIATTKNSEPKVLPLLPVVLEELRKFKSGHGHVLVFASRVRPDVPYNFEEAWRLALKQARVPRFRFHDLRHTCASYLAQNGASLLEIADVMGHRQLAMVKRYAHLTTKSKAALVNRVLGAIR